MQLQQLHKRHKITAKHDSNERFHLPSNHLHQMEHQDKREDRISKQDQISDVISGIRYIAEKILAGSGTKLVIVYCTDSQPYPIQ